MKSALVELRLSGPEKLRVPLPGCGIFTLEFGPPLLLSTHHEL